MANMKVSNHRLIGNNGKAVPLVNTPNKSSSGIRGGKPKYIIVHYTANGSAKGALNTMSNPARKASAHLVVGHDGAVTQMGRFNEKLWHAGKSSWKGIIGLNSHSVGIEIVNWGKLKGGSGNYKSWTGKPIADDRVIVSRHKNGEGPCGWEIFDEEQVESCIDIVRALADEYGLGPENILGHDDISPRRKIDPGPAWDMRAFRAAVFGRDGDDEEDEMYEVIAGSGLNMREGPSTSHSVIKKLPRGSHLEKVDEDGAWWMVAEIKNGDADDTGWVHSRWVREI